VVEAPPKKHKLVIYNGTEPTTAVFMLGSKNEDVSTQIQRGESLVPRPPVAQPVPPRITQPTPPTPPAIDAPRKGN
jgi:hypothetical protein